MFVQCSFRDFQDFEGILSLFWPPKDFSRKETRANTTVTFSRKRVGSIESPGNPFSPGSVSLSLPPAPISRVSLFMALIKFGKGGSEWPSAAAKRSEEEEGTLWAFHDL